MWWCLPVAGSCLSRRCGRWPAPRCRANGQGALTAAACVGTFVLAEAACSTEKRPPHLAAGPCVEAVLSAAAAGRDATRRAIRRGGHHWRGASGPGVEPNPACHPEPASVKAKYLVADARTSQAAYTIPSHSVHADFLVYKFECCARQRLGFLEEQMGAPVQSSST